MLVHEIILNSTYFLLIDEFFFYYGILYRSTRYVRDYIEEYIYLCTNIYSTYTRLIYFSNIYKTIGIYTINKKQFKMVIQIILRFREKISLKIRVLSKLVNL